MFGKNLVNILGIGAIISCALCTYLIYELWPVPLEGETLAWASKTSIFGLGINLSDDQRVILLVILSGFLGSFVHVVSSFTNYVGDRKFEVTWLWWYILRPFIGMSLALIFYFVFRGGLFAGNTLASDLNIYGVLTLAALSGLFSDRATLKLEEIYESLFKPKDNRGGKLKDNQNTS
ncbi:hypothetical protein [Fulvivirga lutea]|uniref:Uncharacterized protein n=1 Tax=Fulvivirga lutea TaxID=2810512 RepID=A0A975A2L1_9BACT|nr:hypothetical protein [Fulvivirga lutea]QSE98652.1 hypothetical protein JR347_06120 [Fulvivirga lutea]